MAPRLHRLYDLAVWPPRIVGLTALWFVGVLAGGIVLGLAPATVAAHQTALRWHDPTELDTSFTITWRSFWSAWRQWIWRSQLPMGLAYLTLVPLIFWARTLGLDSPLAAALLCLTVVWLITIQWVPTALVGAKNPRKDLVRITLHLAWRRWPATLGLMALLAALGIAGSIWAPFALPFVFPGLPVILITGMARRLVHRERADQDR